MTKPALIAILLSSSLIAACGGSSAPEPGTGKPAETPAALPPNTIGPAGTPPVTAPDAAVAPNAAPNAPVAPSPPARPAFTRTDLQIGSGREAVKGKSLSVNYTGWLYDPTKPDLKGKMFDTSKGREPLTFMLGVGQVINGWDEGFQGMKIGGRRRLTIPPDLAYGADGAGGGLIPPNATLIFEMELLDVQQ